MSNLAERLARFLWRFKVTRPAAERLAMQAWLSRRGPPRTYGK